MMTELVGGADAGPLAQLGSVALKNAFQVCGHAHDLVGLADLDLVDS